MDNESEDANPQVELLLKSYIWPVNDANKFLKAQRDQKEEENNKKREDELKKKVDSDSNAQKTKLLKQQEAKKQQERKLEEEKRRKEEEEQRNKLEGRFELMIDNLKKNNTPQEYTLAGLPLNNIKLRMLINNARENTTLLGLDLARMKIAGGDLNELHDLLVNNKTLQKLELEGNEIEPNDAITLAKALEVNTTLRSLNLGFNPLTRSNKSQVMKESKKYDYSGISRLSNMLKTNRTLLILNLARTGIDRDGAIDLLEAMEINTTLISMDLSENDLSVRDIRQINDYLKRNKKMYDEERLREFRERKMMNEEDTKNKDLIDIEEKKKEQEEIKAKNKQERMAERQKKYAEMVLFDFIIAS